jgi:hypothetical protein
MNKAEQRHHDIVRSLGCVICRKYLGVRTPPQNHHIAEGSAPRSEFMIAGLCQPHHKDSGYGFHDGTTTFLRQWRLPTEYHLLGLVNEFRAEDGV